MSIDVEKMVRKATTRDFAAVLRPVCIVDKLVRTSDNKDPTDERIQRAGNHRDPLRVNN